MIPTATRLSYANGYLELGMLDEAGEELDAIEPADHLRPEVLGLRAKYFLERQNWTRLETVSRQLVEADPDDPIGWVHWAYALRELDRSREAKTVAERGLRRHPEIAVLWYNLACYCSLLGHQEDAAKHLEKAVLLDESFSREADKDPDLRKLHAWKNAEPDS